MIDLPPVDAAPFTLSADQSVEKRKGRSTGVRRAVATGTIIMLPDGSECRVEGFDTRGNPLCALPSP